MNFHNGYISFFFPHARHFFVELHFWGKGRKVLQTEFFRHSCLLPINAFMQL